MTSDILGIVPRLASPLSSVVHRKTNGNPFYIKEFLRSLNDNNFVTYSLREKSWIWDIDSEFKPICLLLLSTILIYDWFVYILKEIISEPITENALQQLVTVKMINLTEKAQTALKIASCFGTKMYASFVEALSGTRQHSNLQLYFWWNSATRIRWFWRRIFSLCPR